MRSDQALSVDDCLCVADCAEGQLLGKSISEQQPSNDWRPVDSTDLSRAGWSRRSLRRLSFFVAESSRADEGRRVLLYLAGESGSAAVRSRCRRQQTNRGVWMPDSSD